MKKLLNKKGFTLMEMLIVVAIIVILVAISIPAFSNSLDSAKQATDAANFRSAKAAYVNQSLAGATDAIDTTKDYYYDFEQGKFVEGDAAPEHSQGECKNHTGDFIKIDHTNGKVVWSDASYAEKCK